MLAYLLSTHGGAVEADLSQYHGIELSDMYAGIRTPRAIANRVLHLPPGAAMWRRVGGSMAVSEPMQAARFTEWMARIRDWNRGQRKGKQPEPLPDPELYTAQEERQANLESKAERWLRRHNDRVAARGERAEPERED